MFADAIPEGLGPGIGLRPGGERPDLEDTVSALFEALYASVVACSRAGLNVVVDVGHHDDYSTPLGILAKVAGELRTSPAFFVGVRCPVEVIMARRDAGAAGSGYARSGPDGTVPEAVSRWERAVHDPGIYDVEVDTSRASPEACAATIARRLEERPPVAFAELAEHWA